MLEQILKDAKWFADQCIDTIGKMEVFQKFYVHYKDSNIIQFADGEYLIEFSFLPEDFPNFMLQTNIGILADNQNVALWFLLSMLKINDAATKGFRNGVELHNLLINIGTNVIEKHYEEIFNTDNISKAYLEMINNIQVKHEEEKFKTLKDKISLEFRNKNYHELIRSVDSNKELCSDKRILKMYEYSLKNGVSER